MWSALQLHNLSRLYGNEWLAELHKMGARDELTKH
jgi:hypothetical protein